MIAVVADTHSVLWYLAGDKRLSRLAKGAMDSATDRGEPIYVPTICLIEATYLVEKKKITPEALALLGRVISQPEAALQALPLTMEIALVLNEIPRTAVPDMPDRVIAASALWARLPLVTRDGKIRASKLETIW